MKNCFYACFEVLVCVGAVAAILFCNFFHLIFVSYIVLLYPIRFPSLPICPLILQPPSQ